MKFKRDFSTKLVDLDAQPIQVGLTADAAQTLAIVTADFSEADKKKLYDELKKVGADPLTLAKVAVNALLSPKEDEKSLGHDEQIRRYELARRLNKGGVQEYNTTERDLIKELVRKTYRGVLIYGLVAELLESAEKVEDAPKPG